MTLSSVSTILSKDQSRIKFQSPDIFSHRPYYSQSHTQVFPPTQIIQQSLNFPDHPQHALHLPGPVCPGGLSPLLIRHRRDRALQGRRGMARFLRLPQLLRVRVRRRPRPQDLRPRYCLLPDDGCLCPRGKRPQLLPQRSSL